MTIPRPVALFGTFDVENYGDLLFPHLAAEGLGCALSELRCFSPKGGALGWSDTVMAEPVHKAAEASPSLCLIGGGNIVHAAPSNLPDYAAQATYAYPALWLGAAVIAARAGARIVWNAPGVPHPIEGAWARRLRDLVLAASDSVAVRDEASRVFLGGGPSLPVSVVPDTALALSRLWSADSLRAEVQAAFAARGGAPPDRWIVFHLNDRYIGPDKRVAIEAVARICAEFQAAPVLIAIGPCHGDDALARAVWSELPAGGLLVEHPRGLREIAGLIAHGAGYVGSSLHGLITALSYRRPAIAVARTSMVKFLGFLEPLNMAERLRESWPDAAVEATALLRPLDPKQLAALGRADARVEGHWQDIRDRLAKPPDPAKVDARLRLLATLGVSPAPYLQWNGLLDAIAGRTPEAPKVDLPLPPPPTADSEPPRPDWVVEADSLGRLIAADPSPVVGERLAAALVRWPHELRFQLLHCEWLERSGDPADAERALRTLHERHSGNPWPAVRLIRLLLAQERFVEARALFENELHTRAVPETVKQDLLTALESIPGDDAGP